MELRQLAYFVGIARAGSFSRAARSLHIAQPALSRQISLLEKELGVLLLTRNGRGAVPTAAGKQLLSRAADILRNIDETRRQIAAMATEPSGVVRIGVPLSISKVLTSDLFDNARTLFPLISLQVSEAWTGHIYSDLLDRKLDFGVISNSQLDGAMVHRQLVTERVHLIKAPKMPPAAKSLRIADLANIPLVVPPCPHGIRLIVDRTFRRYAIKPNIVLESEVWPIISDVVRKGIACALFPPREMHYELTSGLLQEVPILNPGIRNGLCLVRLASNAALFNTDPVFEFVARHIKLMIRAEK